MIDKIFEILSKLTDPDTIIILAMAALAFYSPEHRELIAAALLGFLGGKIK